MVNEFFAVAVENEVIAPELVSILTRELDNLVRSYRTIGLTNVAAALGTSKDVTVLDDVYCVASLFRMHGWFIYRGSNHIAIHLNKKSDRAILISLASELR